MEVESSDKDTELPNDELSSYGYDFPIPSLLAQTPPIAEAKPLTMLMALSQHDMIYEHFIFVDSENKHR